MVLEEQRSLKTQFYRKKVSVVLYREARTRVYSGVAYVTLSEYIRRQRKKGRKAH